MKIAKARVLSRLNIDEMSLEQVQKHKVRLLDGEKVKHFMALSKQSETGFIRSFLIVLHRGTLLQTCG